MTQVPPTSTATLDQLLVPRDTGSGATMADTVLDIRQLTDGRINPAQFFEQNHITAGMNMLLDQCFRRLSGMPGNGIFLLRQSMGGGKTHNLVTLGLLAANPLQRTAVITDPVMQPILHKVGQVQVVAFSGRTRPQNGLWGLIAEQLGDKPAFNDFYGHLQAPGQEHWEALLRGRTALILLDELPPYLSSVRSTIIGHSDLAQVTSTALTNLMAALQSPGCERVALVITDLGATAHAEGGEMIQTALENFKTLSDLQGETQRLAMTLEPVQQNSNELYDILRLRLFQQTPSKAEVARVRDLHAHEIDKARKMGLTSSDGGSKAGPIMDTYPFHPSLRDLYGRFRENPGFQQTRGLLRMMQAAVAHLWESGQASKQHLIGLQDLDLNNDRIRDEFFKINPYFKDAVSHDVADEGKAVAEQDKHPELAQQAATLLLASSLTQVADGVSGLSAADVADALAQPGRDLSPLSGVLSELAQRSWYLHRDGAMFRFTTTRNINAEIEDSVRTMSEEKALSIVRDQLMTLFNPLPDGAYKEVQIFPQLGDIHPVEKHVTLVLTRPQPGELNPQLRELFNASNLQNRLMFLTGENMNYQTLLERAKVLQATGRVLDRLKRTSNSSPESIKELEDRVQTTELQFFTAAQEAFTRVYFPDNRGLSSFDFTGKFAEKSPASRGAEQLQQALVEKKKFLSTLPDVEADRFEDRVFGRKLSDKTPGRSLGWPELLKRAASTTGWPWHPAGALEDLRRRQVDRGNWRMDGQNLLLGPFAQEETSVAVRHEVLDAAADRFRLTVTPSHGKDVHHAPGDTVDISCPLLTSDTLEVTGETFSFLAVDPQYDAATNKGHPTGSSATWNAPTWITGTWDDGTVTLRASPGAEIRVTYDGSAAGQGQVAQVDQPLTPPPNTHVVQAIATRGGRSSVTLQLKRHVSGPDPLKPATWKRSHKATSTPESNKLLERLDQHHARISGVKVTANGSGERFGTAYFSEDTVFTPEALRDLSTYIRNLIGEESSLHLTVEKIAFERGQGLIDWADDEGVKLNMSEVEE